MHTSKTVISNSIHTCMTAGSYNAHNESNVWFNIQALNIGILRIFDVFFILIKPQNYAPYLSLFFKLTPTHSSLLIDIWTVKYVQQLIKGRRWYT